MRIYEVEDADEWCRWGKWRRMWCVVPRSRTRRIILMCLIIKIAVSLYLHWHWFHPSRKDVACTLSHPSIGTVGRKGYSMWQLCYYICLRCIPVCRGNQNSILDWNKQNCGHSPSWWIGLSKDLTLTGILDSPQLKQLITFILLHVWCQHFPWHPHYAYVVSKPHLINTSKNPASQNWALWTPTNTPRLTA